MGSNESEASPLHGHFEPVAIIGMGCRWPGDSAQPSELWDFLQGGNDAYSEFPADRMNVDSFYHEKNRRPGSFYTRGGCFLKSSPHDFDNSFFGITPQEVSSMDPSQKKLLETVYETFESAGVSLRRLSGSKTGCFVGNFNNDHQLMQFRDPEFPEPYALTGSVGAMLSNRINYVFNLKGPSMTVDTACSSSMYALHLACSAIHNDDCDGAIVAGSNLILTPEVQISSSTLGAVSATSRCHTFDASADGYARADGIGALYIKKLADAIRDNDPIRAVIRGTAVNTNGKTGGITHPSSDGQEAVIRQAYKRAGRLDYSMTAYVECHGTGTPVGDPLEIAAIARVFADNRPKSNPLLVGSIKSNIGHNEAASGIAGVMKVVLALEHGVIPPTVGFINLNPNVELMDGRLKIVTENTQWPKLPVRTASVNSFGFGGANAHVILEAASSFLIENQWSKNPPDRVGTAFSGFRNSRLNNQFGIQINGNSTNVVADKYSNEATRACHRDQFLLGFSAHNEHKCFVIAKNKGVRAALSSENITVHRKQRSQLTRLGFVFTGQGAQWSHMGLDLMDSFPSYLETIRLLDTILGELESPPTWTLEGTFRIAPTRDLDRAELSQPATTAIQIALVELLISWNIKLIVTVGHSSGEIGAAYAAGLITMRDAITIAYLRGKVTIQNTGALMLAVGVGEKVFKSETDSLGVDVIIACYNSPESMTLSGKTEDILAVKALLEAKKIFTKVLATGGNAYHSPHMQPLGSIYEEQILENCSRNTTERPHISEAFIVSSVTGRLLTREDHLGANYWRRNLESPVRFKQAIEELMNTVPVDNLVEIGPHTALRSSLQQIAKSMPEVQFPEYGSTLVRGKDCVSSILTAAGNLWVKGYSVDLHRVNAIEGDKFDSKENGVTLIDLPHYQWQYEKQLFLENRWTREWRSRKHPRHDILGSRVPGGITSDPTWRNILRPKDLPWLTDHRIESEIVFPAAGYMCMAFEAATQAFELGNNDEQQRITCYDLHDVSFQAALVVPDNDYGVEILLILHPTCPSNERNRKSLFNLRIVSVVKSDDERFIEHAQGRVSISSDNRGLMASVSAYYPTPKLKTAVSISPWYDSFARTGLNYGPIFQGLSHIKASGNDCTAEANVQLVPAQTISSSESRYIVHPAALDACLQLSIVASHSCMACRLQKRYLPVSLDRITVQQPLQVDLETPALGVSTGNLRGVRGLLLDLTVIGASKRVLVDIKGLLLLAPEQGLPNRREIKSPYARMIWKPDFDSLTNEDLRQLYPPLLLKETAIIPSLNHLALHQLVQFYTSPELFKAGHDAPHLQHLLNWIERKMQLIRDNHYPYAKEVLEYSVIRRAEEIERLSVALNKSSVESQTMCRIYRHLPAIFKGQTTGIQVALQENLLHDMYETGQLIKEGSKRLAAVIELLTHQNSRSQFLEIGAGTGSATRKILPVLRGETLYRRYKKYVFTDITPSFLKNAEDEFQSYRGVTYTTFNIEKPASDQEIESNYDVVIASNVVHASSDVLGALRNIRGVLQTGGKIILLEITQPSLFSGILLGTFSDFWNGNSDKSCPRFDGPFISKSTWSTVLSQTGFGGVDFLLDDFADHPSCSVLVATATDPNRLIKNPQLPKTDGLTLVYRSVPKKILSSFTQCAVSRGLDVELCSIANPQIPRYRSLVFLVEFDAPLFKDITLAEWDGLQTLLKHASSILWVTSGGILSGREPWFSMIGGIARGLKTERNQLRFSILDLDQDIDASIIKTCKAILNFLNRGCDDSTDAYNIEFRQRNGITFRGSLEPDNILNEEWRSRGDGQASVEFLSWNRLEKLRLRLDIDKPGMLNTLLFKEDQDFSQLLPDGFVEIKVKAIGVNHRDILVLNDKRHSNAFSSECAGIIAKVAKDVVGFKPGDRVFCPSFAKFGNYARERASSCQKLEETDSFEEMATMPFAFCMAINGLMSLAPLSKDEAIFIQSATSNVGLGAIQIAHLCGAEIFATVGTVEEKKYLSMHFRIQADHIYMSQDKTTTKKILEHTGGQGVDMIFSDSHTDLVQEYWRCIASFGRFVEIGRSEVSNNEQIDTKTIFRNSVLICYDMETLSNEKPATVARLMATVKDLHLQQRIKPTSFTKFHISEIESALAFSTPHRNVIVTFDESAAAIKFRKSVSEAQFDPDAAYLLVGCLGGLGKTYSRWMVDRGAKNLIFLSRSGSDKQESLDFLAELENRNVFSQVVKGDVASMEDVKRAVACTTKPIKGVVQAALILEDKSLENMTLDMFNTTVRPRTTGMINLHHALHDSPLDFFMMWSSWTAIFGTATQANYLASCSFMDAFARHRHRLGLSATSLSLSPISNVGAVGRNPLYVKALTRNGLYSSDEDDFLQYCESAIDSGLAGCQWDYDPLAKSHLLVGIEPTALDKLHKTYPLNDMGWYNDSRFSNLVQAIDNLSSSEIDSLTIASNEDEGDEAIHRIYRKAAQLLYISEDIIDTTLPINEYGIDSMIAAELRNWLFATFATDVSLFSLLSPSMTIERLASEVSGTD